MSINQIKASGPSGPMHSAIEELAEQAVEITEGMVFPTDPKAGDMHYLTLTLLSDRVEVANGIPVAVRIYDLPTGGPFWIITDRDNELSVGDVIYTPRRTELTITRIVNAREFEFTSPGITHDDIYDRDELYNTRTEAGIFAYFGSEWKRLTTD